MRLIADWRTKISSRMSSYNVYQNDKKKKIGKSGLNVDDFFPSSFTFIKAYTKKLLIAFLLFWFRYFHTYF
jgi:hypothetical protein